LYLLIAKITEVANHLQQQSSSYVLIKAFKTYPILQALYTGSAEFDLHALFGDRGTLLGGTQLPIYHVHYPHHSTEGKIWYQHIESVM
jgi:hypothetical protein